MEGTLTPMMQQYKGVKQNHPDSILFFRLGDFYEMFFEDAQKASRVLNIALTAREAAPGYKAPMCGIPYHAAESYIAKLLSAGMKVAICEQMEDPKAAKGIVKREVIRTITPGTVIEAGVVADKKNNFLASLALRGEAFGLSFIDITTGEFQVTELVSIEDVTRELIRISPSECLISQGLAGDGAFRNLLARELPRMMVSLIEDWKYDFETCLAILKEHFHVQSLDGFGCRDMTLGIVAAGLALNYVKETLGNGVHHVGRLLSYRRHDSLGLDRATLRNLELLENLHPQEGNKGTLLWVLDQTRTAMGTRLLRHWITHPLLDLEKIRERQEGIIELSALGLELEKLREALVQVRDLERLTSRIHCGFANARDLVALSLSLEVLPSIREILAPFESLILRGVARDLVDLKELMKLIREAIVEDPPLTLREGGLIRRGYDSTLDELREIAKSGKDWISELQKKEIGRTGIKSLKVGYNRVFGYYIEVTSPNLAQVPADYIRKQTLSNAERFITQELKNYEEKVLGAQGKSQELEYEIFLKVREEVKRDTVSIQKIAQAIATLDVLVSLTLVALKNDYVRPEVNDSDSIDIEEGRHPVVEQISLSEKFVPNDTFLDLHENQILVITGPNMAGKSTYLRQVALMVLMAQMGSFVPAKRAVIGWVDQIFTRIGASDELARGQSTFMVEMNETANILHHATSRSLVILDEIGRGTSTFDGISIAWAVAEYLHNDPEVKARTLFATHYHELTDLELTLAGVKNYNVLVREWNDQIIFVRKIVKGAADKSYGIHVARLAGLPKPVIERAKGILSCLEEGAVRLEEMTPLEKARSWVERDEGPRQLSLFDGREGLTQALKEVEVDYLTPMEALLKLKELKERFVK
ncbi:MAG: DNA mismatch repair protein MutS [Chlamydiae bacterium]|nr:DNA mismatch repair protein MutS [Chlamydiota bacterium]MBI3266541.1 DNA mismatch repair protein MutS [Chlamydiota bacterium]